jgi:hypothetical protein
MLDWTRMPNSSRSGAAILLAAVLASLGPALQAWALPRYSARYEQNCALCHVNPTGGGMRSAYAVQQLIPKEFAISPATPEILKDIDPRIGKHVSIGTDFRQLFLLESERSPLAAQQGFFPMQGDLYLLFQLDPRFLLYYDRGFSNTYEAFGLANVLPWDGYVKVGRFVPPYGWKFDDHTMFVRDDEGFAPPANSDGGMEVGFAPEPFDVEVALVNGDRGATLDSDRRLAVSGNASGRFRVGPVAGLLGVAGYTQPGLNVDVNNAGVFGYLTGWNVTWVAQSDWTRRQPAGGTALSGLVTSQELTVLLHRGVELKATYDFYDPDRTLRSGSKDRWGAGFDVMPRSFLMLEAVVRRTRVQSGPALSDNGYDEGLFQLHLLY